jgi:hypothetical protein
MEAVEEQKPKLKLRTVVPAVCAVEGCMTKRR